MYFVLLISNFNQKVIVPMPSFYADSLEPWYEYNVVDTKAADEQVI
jgi:hypothetical protein